jgi:hypothetical protein
MPRIGAPGGGFVRLKYVIARSPTRWSTASLAPSLVNLAYTLYGDEWKQHLRMIAEEYKNHGHDNISRFILMEVVDDAVSKLDNNYNRIDNLEKRVRFLQNVSTKIEGNCS